MDDRELSRRIAEQAPEAAVEVLLRYTRLLEQWSARHSLVRFSSIEDLLQRHVLEALVALPQLPEAGRLIDVGSGAGLPGLPLLACRPGWSGVLVEPRQKRWAFLKRAIRVMGVQATVEECRYEDLTPAGLVELITVRALTVDADLLIWASSVLIEGGKILVWGTEAVEKELRRHPGWRVLSSPFMTLERGRLIEMEQCFT